MSAQDYCSDVNHEWLCGRRSFERKLAHGDVFVRKKCYNVRERIIIACLRTQGSERVFVMHQI